MVACDNTIKRSYYFFKYFCAVSQSTASLSSLHCPPLFFLLTQVTEQAIASDSRAIDIFVQSAN